MQLQREIANALLSYPGETAVAVGQEGNTAIILKSQFEYSRYPSCLVIVTPMAGMYAAGPVFRLGFQFAHQITRRPIYSGETFLNPLGQYDAPLIRNLTRQSALEFHFFNLDLAYVGSKRIRWNPQTATDIRGMIHQCAAHAGTLPAGTLDFVLAREAMIAEIGEL